MDIVLVQREVAEWHRRNYPKDGPDAAFLGIMEELGELARAELKQAGGIRGSWDEWQEEKFKELGDVVIGLFNYADFVRVPMHEVLKMALCGLCSSHDRMKVLKEVNKTLSRIADDPVAIHIAAMFAMLEHYGTLCGFGVLKALESRWETISKRDFIANPASGGRETETLDGMTAAILRAMNMADAGDGANELRRLHLTDPKMYDKAFRKIPTSKVLA